MGRIEKEGGGRCSQIRRYNFLSYVEKNWGLG